MPFDLKVAIGGAGGSPIGATALFPVSEKVLTNPVITVGDATYLRSGVMMYGESATYPEAFALMGKPGRYWEVQPYGGVINNTAYDAIYANGIYLVMLNTTRVIYSYDGVTWNSVTTPLSVLRIVYGNGVFVAISAAANTQYMTSPDGINWTVQAWGSSINVSALLFGNGKFVGITSASPSKVITSTDGVNWTTTSPAGITDNIGASFSVFGNFAYVFYHTGNIYYLTADTVNWYRLALPTVTDYTGARIFFAGNIFIACLISSSSSLPCLIFTSSNGSQWTLASSGLVNSTQAPNRIVGSGNTFYFTNSSGAIYLSLDMKTITTAYSHSSAVNLIVDSPDSLLVFHNLSPVQVLRSAAAIGNKTETIVDSAIQYVRIK